MSHVVAVAALFLVSHCLLGVGGVGVPMQDLSLDRSHGRRLATQQWCIAKPNLQDANYQGALDWACGPLSGQGQVNCGPIQPGQSCYLPNTYQSHASWAFNAYYQTHGQTAQACDFQGTAVISTTDPSTSTCPYTASNGTTSAGINSTSGAVSDYSTHTRSLPFISALVSVISFFIAT
ncbi:glucan endo-1,3-beta-glucosidase 1 isoform X1 [Physcomitrium patens]|uniref:X8 domain-containing protein n=2 Tax=Physcomitrium patens TaxID=3218 RepID=A0A2K1IMI2_PHYPA|nr:glucan endo-1,3-beta-glucosidase 1-like isoform X1 [Physcomitrium patens]PNR30480.1 hypothetical protein PHYPA_026796 [Physcomitrium patens]|eukprot:XP_024360784.1 glucan endo-1,3-beta-glucosidase 1-like isoform X1 [Physcomitrella patens]